MASSFSVLESYISAGIMVSVPISRFCLLISLFFEFIFEALKNGSGIEPNALLP